MLLQRLAEYADRLDQPPPNYVEKPIPWIIDLDNSGDFIGFVQTGDLKDRSKQKAILCPHIMRGMDIKAKLLADNGEYVLGVVREGGDAAKVKERHAAFVKTVRECAETTHNPDVKSVLSFLENFDPSAIELPPDLDPSHELTFRVDDRLPVDHPDVRAWWASTFENEGAEKMQCIVCGKMRRPEKRLQQKIKGIPGGQPTGNAVISANAPAFESYGLEASLIAPTCRDCSEKFSLALNSLIRGRESRVVVGPVIYIFWTREKTDFSAAGFFSDPKPEAVKALIESVFKGDAGAASEDLTPFYACAFTASGARVALRDWIETTVGSVKRNLARYFRLQRIVDWDGSESKPFKVYGLSGSTVRELKDLPARVPRGLIRFALAGGRLPDDLLFQAVKRNRAEQGVNRPRAALIKLVLLSHGDFGLKEENMEQLDLNNRESAYLCGRLLAVLESVQRMALGDIGATIVDRYFGAASSAPATVFGSLMRGAQPHLTKLRKEKKGLYFTMEHQIEEITAGLHSFPLKLSMKEQGLFSLGYYHQRAHRKVKDENHKSEE